MNRLHHWIVLATGLVLVVFLMCSQLVAQSAAPSETITIKVIEQRREQVAAAGELDEDVKNSISENYAEATKHLNIIPTFEQSRTELAEKAQSVNRRVEEDKQALTDLKASQPQPVTQETANEIKGEVLRRQEKLRKTQEELAENEQRTAARQTDRKGILDRLAAIETRLPEIDTELAAAPPTGENPLLTLSRRSALLAEKLRLQAEQPMKESELLLLDSEDAAEYLRFRRDLLSEQTARAKTELELAQESELDKRLRAAKAAAAEARNFAAQVPQPLRPEAVRNAQLANRVVAVIELIENAANARDAILAARDQRKDDFDLTRNKVESVGLPASLAAVLRRQRNALMAEQNVVKARHDVAGAVEGAPDKFLEDLQRLAAQPIPPALTGVRELRRQTEQRQILADMTQLDVFDLREENKRLMDRDWLRTRLNEFNIQLRTVAEDILKRRRTHLDSLIQAEDDFHKTLSETSVKQRQLADINEQFAKYIDARILWVQSDTALWQLAALKKANTQDVAVDKLREAAGRVGRDVGQQPILYGIFLVSWAALLRLCQTLKRALPQLARRVRRRRSSRFTPTLRAAVYSLAMALPVPLLFWFLASRFDAVAGDLVAGRVLAGGVRAFALSFFPFELFRQFCCPHGLAPAHFAWPDSSVEMLRKSCRALSLTLPPLLLIGRALAVGEEKALRNPLEQILFLVCLALCAYHVSRLLHAKHGIFRRYLRRDPNSWAARLRYVWLWAAVGLPVALAVLVVQGYFYTSRQLAVRIYASVVSVAALVIVYSLISRFFAMQRRRLHLEQMKLRREALAAATSDDETAAAAVTLSVSRDQMSQTKRIVGWFLWSIALIGLWFAWRDVLPALDFLEKWPLWTSTQTIAEVITDDAGNESVRTRQVIDPVTIAELAAAVLFGVITFVAAQNLPGLLEISVLRRLPIDESVRYAITTLGRYLIIMLGLVVTCRWIGLRWNQIQWMATALTFGLAFGLQEMFANFVAGIIILFEQPIRVGDIVTVDEVTGKVARVRIRATTITNWDRKDYVVPNKDFITGRVLNWTLSDKVNRIVLTVGVAYGSDKNKVRLILLDLARRHPLIVDDPEPTVTFEEFAASSLTFVLRAYIDMRNMPMRMQVMDDLHTGVDDAFRDAGIEIAYNQQDIRIRELPNGAPEQAGDQSSYAQL